MTESMNLNQKALGTAVQIGVALLAKSFAEPPLQSEPIAINILIKRIIQAYLSALPPDEPNQKHAP